MSPEEVLSWLRDAAGDARALRGAVRRAGQAMAETAMERTALADVLVGLSRHADDGVRKELAEISHLLPEPFFGAAYAVLSKDDNGFVENAAARAAGRKALEDQGHERQARMAEDLVAVIRELGARFGKDAQRLGERAATLGSADKGARARHELGRGVRAMGTALADLSDELEKDVPGPGTLRAIAATLRERHENLAALLDREVLPAAKTNKKKPEAAARAAFTRERLVDLVQTAKSQVLAALPAGVDVLVQVDRALLLDADGPSLRQALENALKNAIEAQRGRPGAVRVCAKELRGGAVVELSIEDQGAGMDDEALARAFVPHASTKLGGTGVGMSTVQRVVEDVHRGEVLVTSAVGEGTRVTMRLPGKQPRGRRGRE